MRSTRLDLRHVDPTGFKAHFNSISNQYFGNVLADEMNHRQGLGNSTQG